MNLLKRRFICPCVSLPTGSNRTHTDRHRGPTTRKSPGCDYQSSRQQSLSHLVWGDAGFALTFSKLISNLWIYLWMHSFPCMPTSSNTTCVLLCFLFLFFCGGQPQVLSSSVTTEASFSPHVLHVTSSISRNVNKHNEPAGQGTVAPLCRWIRTQTHRLHSSAQTAWKNIRQEKRRGGRDSNTREAKELGEGARVSDWETPQQHISHNC